MAYELAGRLRVRDGRMHQLCFNTVPKPVRCNAHFSVSKHMQKMLSTLMENVIKDVYKYHHAIGRRPNLIFATNIYPCAHMPQKTLRIRDDNPQHTTSHTPFRRAPAPLLVPA
jgi:hypothetical protein